MGRAARHAYYSTKAILAWLIGGRSGVFHLHICGFSLAFMLHWSVR
jgi:hypothetical protein